jgi:hypothetical protein
MWGQRIAGVALLAHFGLTPSLLPISGTPAPRVDNDPKDDALAVFCLSPEHRERLADAARTLGVASPTPSAPDRLFVGNQNLDLEAWRESHNSDFVRVCEALVATEPQVRVPESPGFWVRMGEFLLPTAVGALLTFLATGWRAAIDRGARDADALRAASSEFRAAMTAYAAEWVSGGAPPPTTVQIRRADLIRQLDRVVSYYPSWKLPAQLRTRLRGREFEERDRGFWQRLAPGDRPAEAARLHDRLGEFDKEVETVATALSRPITSRLPGSRHRRR